ncbi:hypothetical protein [Paraburkholderia silvatlantica]|uniref:Uncharacterized protein n=1 Tax=Paraburkholderia silvatlantica TaxID=321895 RepID=A0A2U1AE36_9BURK|nr:hypothetical protein [Paraburkholderia silvatlantica]MBB2928269.1 hypothetical protein [Paraburkholderia silvatlantica]PVY34684.1 hypothetical protein C7411_107225 [Paraburkholderia silvatlantica]PXW38899.1 hypothetical protein C7413_107225 [Paraburkholderia silvatlantica]PYE22435.1 hypothetical protein C7410_11056 [Paraburkholderia silvatlantica]TDQ89711.1 hypothetical protein C7412_114164 [Paraburkholderia silvatlantica]
MKSMNLPIRGIMVSLSTLALFAPTASFVSFSATAQPPHASAPTWSMSHSGAHALPPAAPGPNAGHPPVPRGDLRGDITDNARRSAPQRQEPTQRR